MPEEQRNMGDQRNCGCGCGNNNNCGGILGGLFGGNGCGCGGNSEILFFIIIFLLLFTNFGCCNN
ncbi:MAG: hypothetical protein HFJ54_05045 [Clostridia bacterium]|nr:hypothetical protein [Clostridia bacterium]